MNLEGVEAIITIAKLIIEYEIYGPHTAGNKPLHSLYVLRDEITRFINLTFYKLRFVNTVY